MDAEEVESFAAQTSTCKIAAYVDGIERNSTIGGELWTMEVSLRIQASEWTPNISAPVIAKSLLFRSEAGISESPAFSAGACPMIFIQAALVQRIK